MVTIDPEREESELREYLGDSYDRSRLERYGEQLDEEFERVGDEQSFYRSSEGYLYNLTAFAMTRTKEPYLKLLTETVAPPARLLDYGCGIGSDGLVLLEEGYRVEFADFDNPSTRYLRWRLDRRGVEAPIYDLDIGRPPTGFDLAFALDVIEHVEDPLAFLSELEERADLVLVNFLEDEPCDTPLHRKLPVRKLVRHAKRRNLREYEVMHGRSHVVLYAPAA
ncbi:MAG: class I SAM-dependent methyltransferase [Thermoleophilaceae bacterium]|nr:class I SAM-dependent methyltransferase [Thermoleophilaceae bacterium]